MDHTNIEGCYRVGSEVGHASAGPLWVWCHLVTMG